MASVEYAGNIAIILGSHFHFHFRFVDLIPCLSISVFWNQDLDVVNDF